MSGKLFDQIFNLKFLAKQLNRQAKKCEKDEKSERLKVKKAIEKGNMDGAQIYAQNAIRKKAEMLNYLRLASRLDAVVSRLDSQAKMQLVTKNMAGIVKSLEKALTSNNLEKVAQTMDSFEKQFENLDVQSDFVNEAMNKQAALSTNEDEVKNLMLQVADEHGLELASALPGAGAQQVASSAQEAVPQDELTKRLAELRGK